MKCHPNNQYISHVILIFQANKTKIGFATIRGGRLEPNLSPASAGLDLDLSLTLPGSDLMPHLQLDSGLARFINPPLLSSKLTHIIWLTSHWWLSKAFLN
jgi:hypothetical protein